MEEKPVAEIKVEEPEPNKYAPKEKVGTPTSDVHPTMSSLLVSVNYK